MPNELGAAPGGNVAAPPPAAGPTEADVRAARAEAAAAELRAQLSAVLSGRVSGAPAAPPQPAEPDPFVKFGEQHLTAQPGEIVRELDRGVRGRIRGEVAPELNRVREEFRGAIDALRTDVAYTTMLATNPDVETDKEGLSAAMARAAFRANAAGLTATNQQLISEGLKIYRESHPAPPPFLEGRGASSPAPTAPDKPKGPSAYEKLYGKDEDDVLHEEEWDPEKALHQYADDRNNGVGFLTDEAGTGGAMGLGLGIERSRIKLVQKETIDRKSRKKAAKPAA